MALSIGWREAWSPVDQGGGESCVHLQMPAMPHMQVPLFRDVTICDVVEGGAHFEVGHGDIDLEFALDELGQFLAETFGVPAVHKGVAVEGFLFVDHAGEG